MTVFSRSVPFHAVTLVLLVGCSGSGVGPTDESLPFSLDASVVTLELFRPEVWTGTVGARYRNPTANAVFLGVCGTGPGWTLLDEKDGQWIPSELIRDCPFGFEPEIRVEPGSEFRFTVDFQNHRSSRMMVDGNRSRTFRIQLQVFDEALDSDYNRPPTASALPFDQRTTSEVTIRLGGE